MRTIATYRSALSTMHAEGAWGHTPNPIANEIIERVMKGIGRKHAERDRAARLSRPRTIDLTPSLLAMLEVHCIAEVRTDRPSTDEGAQEWLAIWAAVCTGTCGMLRVSELLGSRQYPERALQRDQVVFYADEEGRRSLSEANAEHRRIKPDHFKIFLGPTKADQAGRTPPVVVGTSLAVCSLWWWTQVRQPHIHLFHTRRDAPPLTVECVIKRMQDLLEFVGMGRPHMTGKAFRRGGASGMVSSGAPLAVTATTGRWSSMDMVSIYANEESRTQALVRASKALVP